MVYSTNVYELLQPAAHVKAYADRVQILDEALRLVDVHTKPFRDPKNPHNELQTDIALQKVAMDLEQYIETHFPPYPQRCLS